jgi:hypothetical protein
MRSRTDSMPLPASSSARRLREDTLLSNSTRASSSAVPETAKSAMSARRQCACQKNQRFSKNTPQKHASKFNLEIVFGATFWTKFGYSSTRAPSKSISS